MESNYDEARSEYEIARRQARAVYAKEVSQGRNGYLPSLEGILEYASIIGERRVGLENVPLRKIVGTANKSRARSFAPKFLPLPKERSEFASKWKQVFMHQIDEGIVDPVELREYLNWYWVVEGNKRVSVLSYLGAYQVEAQVTRLTPHYDENDPAVVTYYRFLPFKEETGISSIWIREEDGYERVLELIRNHYGVSAEDPFEKRKGAYRRFYSLVYLPFRDLYKSYGGDRLSFTTGEAFLRYVEIVGFPEGFYEPQEKRSVESVIKELSVSSDDIGITTGPLKRSGPTLLGTLGRLMRPERTLDVAFVHYGSKSVSTWNRDHDAAIMELNNSLRGKVKTQIYRTEENETSFVEVIRKAAESAEVVFSTAAILYEATRKVAIEYQNVRFFVASREKSGRHVRTYSPRTHEVHYLSGLIAGALRKKKPIYFVLSNYSAYSFASINAFALGARGVNRFAEVKLVINEHGCKEGASDILPDEIEPGDVLFFHDIIPFAHEECDKYGLYSYQGSNFARYAAFLYDWGEFYRDVLGNILSGNIKDFDSENGGDAKFLTYWGGLRNGILDLLVNDELISPEIRRVVEGIKRLMLLDEFTPFDGPILDRRGEVRVHKDERLDYDGIISMDYLVKGVTGPPPDPDDVITS